MLDDPDALLAEFEAGYGRTPLRKKCRVCDSEHRDLIDLLLRRGAGCPSISKFLFDKYDMEIGQATVNRHKMMHLNARATQENC